MVRRDQLLGAQRRQHGQLRIRLTSHAHSLFDPGPRREHPQPNFSTLLGVRRRSERASLAQLLGLGRELLATREIFNTFAHDASVGQRAGR
jgi:hypothetical protein